MILVVDLSMGRCRRRWRLLTVTARPTAEAEMSSPRLHLPFAVLEDSLLTDMMANARYYTNVVLVYGGRPKEEEALCFATTGASSGLSPDLDLK